ncbi:hypothetical protein KEM56_004043 [Ascosphaera pollenicola]|nr:hypothetical protein KEM56_004043 [Ascosphaera pollenicola]
MASSQPSSPPPAGADAAAPAAAAATASAAAGSTDGAAAGNATAGREDAGQNSAPATSPPVAIVCVGMAGSGKTTFMQRINSHLHSQRTPPYVVNLDPAVINVPFESNIDIRDSINYKEVMKQYNLGPNGGILTSLNLFTTKVDQVMNILEKRLLTNNPATGQPNPDARPSKHILVDTPGQIEVFVWSASGSILLETLASTFPTVIAYVIDTPRTSSTSTFMSNMLYACSILYKTRLPMILVFNKTDVRDAEFAKEWMTDFEAFQAALTQEEERGMFGSESNTSSFGGSGYMGSYLNSMSLMLEEFYRYLNVVGVSSMTGAGVDDFFAAVEEKRQEFERDYKPEFERRKKEKEENEARQREAQLGKLMRDMNVSGSTAITQDRSDVPGTSKETDTISEAEEEEEEDDDDDDDDNYIAPGDLDSGLAQRYREALGTKETQSDEDKAFQRYLRTNNFG